MTAPASTDRPKQSLLNLLACEPDLDAEYESSDSTEAPLDRL
jgi:hypothetical protein